MLLRMYLRWCERRGFKAEVVDLLPGEEAGIKSATIEVTGEFPYGYLRGEAGVHRLVRISPFDASRRRQTSFASVAVVPGGGRRRGQRARTTSSASTSSARRGRAGRASTRRTPPCASRTCRRASSSQCQNERSQLRNRDTAHAYPQGAALRASPRRSSGRSWRSSPGHKKEIAFGSQIRSYTFHPYQLVKDHRTGLEVGNVEGVMDGDLDAFIRAYLLWRERTDGVGLDGPTLSSEQIRLADKLEALRERGTRPVRRPLPGHPPGRGRSPSRFGTRARTS